MKIYTTGKVATICGVSQSTVRKWLESGQLEGYVIPCSKDRRVTSEQLKAFLIKWNCPVPDELNEEEEFKESVSRIEELQANMDRLQKHTDKLVAIATDVVRKSHRNDLYFIDCLRVDSASSLRLALVELSDCLREW